MPVTAVADPLTDRFWSDLLANPHNRAILERWDELALPDGWLVAGCLFQTVWNLRSGAAPATSIKDYDLFYFDTGDLSRDGERMACPELFGVLCAVIGPRSFGAGAMDPGGGSSASTWPSPSPTSPRLAGHGVRAP